MKLTKTQLKAIFDLAEQFGQEKVAEVLNIDLLKLEKKEPDEYRLFIDTWTKGRIDTLTFMVHRLKDACNDPSSRLPAVLAYLSKFSLEEDTWPADSKNLAGSNRRIKIELG